MTLISRTKIRRLLLNCVLLIVFCLLIRKLHSRILPTVKNETVVKTLDGNLPIVLDAALNPSEDLLLDALEREVPNLPYTYWRQHRSSQMHYKKPYCAPLPSIFELDISNVYWQTLYSGSVTVQMLNAYYDERMIDTETPAIRVVAMINRANVTTKIYCQLWLEGQLYPVIVGVKELKLIWYSKWLTGEFGDYHPYLVTCALPHTLHQIPSAISFVNKPCDKASNILKVVYQPPTIKKNFAVCVKGLDYLYVDYSLRLVEWIELLSLLGADKFFFYQLQIHPNMSRVLNLYQKRGLVEVIPITLPGTQPNHPILQHLYLQHNKVRKRFNEVVLYNDCFYRNFNLYKYVVVLDLDEVIMPVNHILNWNMLVDTVKTLSEKDNITFSSFYARHVYFFDDNLDPSAAQGIPSYLFMTQHVYRAENFTEQTKFVKTFCDTERVITLHNHLPLTCKGGRRCYYAIPTSLGRLHHYRKDCDKSVRSGCEGYKNNSILDTNIWKYTEDLILRTSRVIQTLRLLR